MNEDIQRLNQIAKALKDSGIAKSMDDAVNMARQMIKQEVKTISELDEAAFEDPKEKIDIAPK